MHEHEESNVIDNYAWIKNMTPEEKEVFRKEEEEY
jgi:hypothetical protein